MRSCFPALLALALAGCGGMFSTPTAADQCGTSHSRGEMRVLHTDQGYWYEHGKGSGQHAFGHIEWTERHPSDQAYWWRRTDGAGRTLTAMAIRKHAPDGTHLFDYEHLVVSYTNFIEARRPSDADIIRVHYLGRDGATMSEVWGNMGTTLRYEEFADRRCIVVGRPATGQGYGAAHMQKETHRVFLDNGNAELLFHVPLEHRDGAGFLTEWGDLGEVLARFDALGPEPGGGPARGKKDKPGAVFE